MASDTYGFRALGHKNGAGRRQIDAIIQDLMNFAPGEYLAYKVKYTDLTAGATTQTLTLASLSGNPAFPANVAFQFGAPFVYLVTPFTGGSLTTMTLTAGDAGNDDELMVAVDVFANAGWKAGIGGVKFSTPQTLVEAAYAPVSLFTGSHNVNTATAGEAIICIPFLQLPANGISHPRA